MPALDALLFVIAALLLVYKRICTKKKYELSLLLLFLIAGTVLALYEKADLAIMLLGIIVFNGIASTYRSKENYVFFLLAIFFILPNLTLSLLISQSMLLGFLSCTFFFNKHTARLSAAAERRRDIIQMLMGLVAVFSFAAFAAVYVKVALMLLIIIFSVLGNFSVRNTKSGISRFLNSLERRDAMFGQGAMWLAIGTLVAFSFLSGRIIIAVLAAVFVGDAAATIVGTFYRRPLPYNKKKSVWGTVAYFVVTSLLTFPFVGYVGIATAAVGALVESAPQHIDDNLDTAVVLTLMIKLLGYFGLV